MQALLAKSPHDALGLLPDASPAEIRSAFLELTKVYHPAKFSRMSPEVQFLSNEVFLALRSAHDSCVKAIGPAPRQQRTTGMPPMQASGTGAHRAPEGSQTMRPQQPPPEGQAPAVRIPQPVRATPGASQTTAKLPVLTRPPEGTGARPTTTANRSEPGLNRAPTSQPAGQNRPTTPTNARAGTQSSRTVTPATGVKSTQQLPVVARPGSPPAATPTAGRDDDFNEQGELRVMKEMVSRQEWGEAVASLTRLLAHNAASKQYRVLLSYCRGREAETAGRLNDAAAEYQRALEIDPEFPKAKSALAELRAKRR